MGPVGQCLVPEVPPRGALACYLLPTSSIWRLKTPTAEITSLRNSLLMACSEYMPYTPYYAITGRGRGGGVFQR